MGFHKFVGSKFSVVTLIMQVKSIFNGSSMFCCLGMVVGSKVKWDLKERLYDWHKIVFNLIEHLNKIRT